MKKAVRVIIGEDLIKFESLLQSNKDICSHHKNIESLMIEMFKVGSRLGYYI